MSYQSYVYLISNFHFGHLLLSMLFTILRRKLQCIQKVDVHPSKANPGIIWKHNYLYCVSH